MCRLPQDYEKGDDMNEELLINDISRAWLRRLHVMGMGAMPSLDEWLARLPGSCTDTLTILRYEESDIGIHHLWLWWKAREMVLLSFPDSRRKMAVVWWIGSDNFRKAAENAATRYFLDTGRDGNLCLTRSIPKGAPRDMNDKPLPIEIVSLGETIQLTLCEARWIPRGYLVVMEAIDETCC